MTTRSHCPIAPLHRILLLVLCQAMVLPSFVTISLAQTVTTNVTSSGLGTTINDAGATQNIRGGTLSSNNLFHSFGEFSIASGDSAVFQNLNGAGTASMVANGATVSNIVGRVTGANPSNIFGLINSSGGFPNANLFLINPSGIVFGPTASINVGGSVHFSTSDYLRFGAGSEIFYADLGKTSTLSSQPVTAFGFLGSNPAGTILVHGGTVANASTLTLVGRDKVEISGATTPGIQVSGGTLSNAGGQVNLVSVKTPANVVAGAEVQASDLAPLGFAGLGSLLLDTNAFIDVSGSPSGRVFIRGGSLVMNQGGILAGNTGATDASGEIPTINIRVDTLDMQNLSSIKTFAASSGNAGFMILQADTLRANVDATGAPLPGNRVTISSESTLADATAGRIGAIDIVGTANRSASASSIALHNTDVTTHIAGGFDDGAVRTAIHMVGHQITLTGGTRVSSDTAGAAPAGHLVIQADTLRANVNATGAPLSGNRVTISSQSTRADATAGHAGEIIIQGTDLDAVGFALPASSIALHNTDVTTQIAGGTTNTMTAFIDMSGHRITLTGGTNVNSDTAGAAAAGNIRLMAGSVTLNGATVSTSSAGASAGAGNAGSVTIQGLGGAGTLTSSITLNNAALSTEAIAGAGGTIAMLASGPMSLANATVSSTVSGGTDGARPPANVTIESGAFNMTGGSITAETGGTAAGGTITATGSSFSMSNGAKISTSSTSADPLTAGTAGNIGLKSATDLTIENSTVTTQAAQASGGDIKLAAPGTILLDNAKIISSVNGPAGTTGGNISIDPQFVIMKNASQILAQAVGGNGGNISIVTNTFLSEPGTLIDASSSLGVSGQISIQSPIQNLAGAIAPLPQSFVSLASLYGQHCAGQKGGQFSSFVQGQRDGLPTQPGDFISSPLSSDLISRDLRSHEPAPASLAAARLGLTDSVSFSRTALKLTSGCRS